MLSRSHARIHIHTRRRHGKAFADCTDVGFRGTHTKWLDLLHKLLKQILVCGIAVVSHEKLIG